MLDRHPTSRLRSLLTIFGLASLLALGACGGGSGAPNNPYDPNPGTPALTVVPTSVIVFSGIPATLTVVSGVAPFSVFSQNPAILPVTQNVPGDTIVLVAGKVSEDTPVQLTVRDAAGQQQTVSVIAKFSPIFNSVTFAPAGGDCGANLCSGQSGTVTVVATGPSGSPQAQRAIRFDVVFGPIGINTTNPATPLVQTLTVTTDSSGKAVAAISAFVNATTQPAQVRVTDVISEQPQIVNFTVVNSTVPSGSPVTVIPPTATITSALTTTCSTGFRVDYYVYGGNPPYTVSSTFPASVTLVNSTVPTSGGFFEAITNGSCVDPLVFTVTDAAGKVASPSPTLINKPGTGTPPVPTALVLAPATVTDINCTGKTYSFIVAGGTPPYNIQAPITSPQIAGAPAAPTSSTAIVPAAGGTFGITFSAAVYAGTVTTFSILDAGTPALTTTGRITCN